MGFFDPPRKRKKKVRRHSAWIEEHERHRHKRAAKHRCAVLRRQGYKCRIATLPNGMHVVFKK